MKNFEIDTDEIKEYLCTGLLMEGYAPGNDELEAIADIMFDFLIDKCIIIETTDEE